MTVNILLGSNIITIRGNQIEGSEFVFTLTHQNTNQVKVATLSATVTGVVINFNLKVVKTPTVINNEIQLDRTGWYNYRLNNSIDGKLVKEGLLYYGFTSETESHYTKNENKKISYEKE